MPFMLLELFGKTSGQIATETRGVGVKLMLYAITEMILLFSGLNDLSS